MRTPTTTVRVLLALGLAAAASAGAGDILQITDEQYYQMPPLFQMDDYAACMARRDVFCVGSFELTATTHPPPPLYQMMQRYSENWADNFNHTRLHRALCLATSCPTAPTAAPVAAPVAAPGASASLELHEAYAARFASCVNASTMSAYKLSARLSALQYCAAGGPAHRQRPLSASERAFAGVLAALLALALVSTVLDLTLSDHAKKGATWALAWSVVGGWRALQAAPPASATADLRAFDGLRVACMMFVIIEHVAWLTLQTFVADPRAVELTRRAPDAMLMSNSTLAVQIFFMMSSFLLAHKLLLERQRGALSSFCDLMVNRVVRISPSYYMVVWFAASWWERLGSGPMWAPLVGTEADICRTKWWTHLLYLNNVLQADDKCLIQTWYLAADMQLYAVSAALTLALARAGAGRGAALAALAALLAASLALIAALAYRWHLISTFVMHNPESVRVQYRDSWSFNVLYQSPLGNLPGALAGLLLAHAHHALRDRGLHLARYKVFGWAAAAAAPLAVLWVAASPLVLGGGWGGRAAAAALATLERPVFAAFVAVAMLGAIHAVPTSLGRLLSWRGWAAWARLSFGALLLHMPLNKALVAARLAPSSLDRSAVIVEWFGVASVSYMAALPLALLVELPAQRLLRALRPAPPPPPAGKTDL